jgi:hypothetical protein
MGKTSLVRIPLTRRKFCIVDKRDAQSIDQHNWYAQHSRGSFYAYRRDKSEGRKLIAMNREILKAPSGSFFDHINRDTLDNRRSNLRICTSPENLRNSGPNARNKSGFKGVYWDREKKKWSAQICVMNKKIHLGRFDEKLEAAIAYNVAAKILHGEFSWLNKI